MNHNPDLTSGNCESVAEILENVPSDAERAATDDGLGRRRRAGARLAALARPASFRIFRPRSGAARGGPASLDPSDSEAETVASLVCAHALGGQAGGETTEERRIGALDGRKGDDIYDIAGDDHAPIDPLSQDYIGIVGNVAVHAFLFCPVDFATSPPTFPARRQPTISASAS